MYTTERREEGTKYYRWQHVSPHLVEIQHRVLDQASVRNRPCKGIEDPHRRLENTEATEAAWATEATEDTEATGDTEATEDIETTEATEAIDAEDAYII